MAMALMSGCSEQSTRVLTVHYQPTSMRALAGELFKRGTRICEDDKEVDRIQVTVEGAPESSEWSTPKSFSCDDLIRATSED